MNHKRGVERAKSDLSSKINQLKHEKNAIILAHYYQVSEIQDVADFVGDSLALAQQAALTSADIIVLAGVHFMAETAKIINPSKKVLLPDLNAGCSLAESCPPNEFKAFLEKHPEHVVVTYVNCSAEIKAMSDLVCTSSNAEKIIASIPLDRPIIFAPDKNLGRYLMKKCNRTMLLWDGACVVHEAFSMDRLIQLYIENPDAQIIAHPESEMHILDTASFIGSTKNLLDYVTVNEGDKFIVATEAGILHKMQLAVPQKTLIPAPSNENNTCACSECAFMKVNTLEKLLHCLQFESPEIELSPELIDQAKLPIERMLDISGR
jgi:quinolinate synthase